MDDGFNKLNLNTRRDFVLNYGEYISEIKYYGFLVQLYVIEGYFIEMYYNVHSREIEEVDILDPLERRLSLYVESVNISSAL